MKRLIAAAAVITGALMLTGCVAAEPTWTAPTAQSTWIGEDSGGSLSYTAPNKNAETFSELSAHGYHADAATAPGVPAECAAVLNPVNEVGRVTNPSSPGLLTGPTWGSSTDGMLVTSFGFVLPDKDTAAKVMHALATGADNSDCFKADTLAAMISASGSTPPPGLSAGKAALSCGAANECIGLNLSFSFGGKQITALYSIARSGNYIVMLNSNVTGTPAGIATRRELYRSIVQKQFDNVHSNS